eukprot:7188310-Prymnesium_polylepis.1
MCIRDSDGARPAVCERARPRETVRMSSAAPRPLQTSSATCHELRIKLVAHTGRQPCLRNDAVGFGMHWLTVGCL